MGVADKNWAIGIHSIALINRSTGQLYGGGEIRCIGDFSLNPNKEIATLIGGSFTTAWQQETTGYNPEATISVMEFPDAIYEVAFGAAVASIAASATGTCGTITNKFGTSLVSATTGIASASLLSGGAANLKTGFYVVQAASATTVDVYYLNTLERTRGTPFTIQDLATNKITSAALTITASTPVTIPNSGIELTGGSGIIALVTGDTAIFYVNAPHGGVSSYKLGGIGDAVPEIGIVVSGKAKDTKKILTVELYRAKDKGGAAMTLAKGDFSNTDLSFDVLYDEDEDAWANIEFAQQV